MALTRILGRKRLRHGYGGRPKRRFAQRVGKELRVGTQDALVNDIDDVAAFPVRKLRCEGLGEKNRSFEIDGHMPAPALGRKPRQMVAGKMRCVVHQAGDRPHRLGNFGDERFNLGVLRQGRPEAAPPCRPIP